jgi:hypothetical protein
MFELSRLVEHAPKQAPEEKRPSEIFSQMAHKLCILFCLDGADGQT